MTFTPVSAGTEAITVDYPADTNYQRGAGTDELTTAKATPTITWGAPVGIVAGTALTATQLDATASFDGSPLAGTFVYSPRRAQFFPRATTSS